MRKVQTKISVTISGKNKGVITLKIFFEDDDFFFKKASNIFFIPKKVLFLQR